MGSFDQQDTAARVREIIKKTAARQISADVPRPLIGRMISVDLTRLRGSVWFPGDEQPIEVSIFANAVPGEWQHKARETLTNQNTGASEPAILDTFSRSVSNGWGVADLPSGATGVYILGTTATEYSVDGSQGIHHHANHNVLRSTRLPVSYDEFDITIAKMTISGNPAVSNWEQGVRARYVDASNFVMARVFRVSTGTSAIAISKVVAGVETISSVPTVSGVTDTSDIALRFQSDGATLRAKAWLAGTTEPANWDVTLAVDFLFAGAVELISRIPSSGGGETFPITFGFDGLSMPYPDGMFPPPAQSSSLVGYGSNVVVQRFNGILYVTHILNGGQFSFDFRSMGFSVITQKALDVTVNPTATVEIAGHPHETFINCIVSDTDLSDGHAIDFGPFTQYFAGPPEVGYMEVTVKIDSIGIKVYRFPVSPRWEFDHPGGPNDYDSWYRIVPAHSINDYSAQDADVDFDIAYKKTAYGNSTEFTDWPEIWFRLIKRGSEWTGLNATVTIRATNIQKGRSLGGRELFMQETRANPPEVKGYIGFHNAQHGFQDFDAYGIMDDFGRTTTNGWGRSDSSQTWSHSFNAEHYCDGNSGVIGVAVNFTGYRAVAASSALDCDMYFVQWVDVAPTGGHLQAGAMARFVDINNHYQIKVEFWTDLTIRIWFARFVAGAGFTIGGAGPAEMSYSAGQKIRCRIAIKGATLYGKVWDYNAVEPEAWDRIHVDGTPFMSSGAFGFRTVTEASNTNTKPYLVHVDEVRAKLTPQVYDNNGSQWHTGPWRSGSLRIAQDLQKTFQTDGRIVWNGTHVLWDGYLRFTGVGLHRYGLNTGRTSCLMPVSGATVPIFPNDGVGATTASVTSSGIPLAVGQSLWVGIPPGIHWDYLEEYLFIVDSTRNKQYQVPEWAVMIASRDNTNLPEIRLGNGESLDKWRAIPFATNWTDFGGGFETGAYRREMNNTVRLRGLIKNTANNLATGTMFTLPVGFRPATAAKLVIALSTQAGSGGFSRISIGTGGAVGADAHFSGGGAGFISLDGITYNLD